MLRRSILATVIAVVLAVGLMSATPTVTAAPAFDNSIGIVKVPDQVRQGNCGSYRLRWRFNPPSDQWTVTANVRTPKGFSIVSQFWDSNARNKLARTQGHLKVRICGSSIKTGRYKIQMKMIYTDGRDNVTVDRAPTYFRLLKRR
jgi:hypothetical protein